MHEKKFNEDISEFIEKYFETITNKVNKSYALIEKSKFKPFNIDFKLFFKFIKYEVEKCQSIDPSFFDTKFFTFFDNAKNGIKLYVEMAKVKDISEKVFKKQYFPENKCLAIIEQDISDKEVLLKNAIKFIARLEDNLLLIIKDKGEESPEFKNANKKLSNRIHLINLDREDIKKLEKIKNNFDQVLHPIFVKVFSKKINFLLTKVNYDVSLKLLILDKVIWAKVNNSVDSKAFFRSFQKEGELNILTFLNYNLKNQTNRVLADEIKSLISVISKEYDEHQ